jgi:CBS domain-containing protein
MITVKDLLKTKGHSVYSTSPDATVYDALKLMSDKGIGALVVLEDEKLVGIISERDYARKVILKGKFSKDTLVREIMAKEIVCISPGETAETCMTLMTDKMIRHLHRGRGEVGHLQPGGEPGGYQFTSAPLAGRYEP